MVTKLRGVPLRFFINTPRRAPMVAMMKVSRTSVSCVETFPSPSNEIMLLIGESPNDMDIALAASMVSVEESTMFTLALTTIRSSSMKGFMS